MPCTCYKESHSTSAGVGQIGIMHSREQKRTHAGCPVTVKMPCVFNNRTRRRCHRALAGSVRGCESQHRHKGWVGGQAAQCSLTREGGWPQRRHTLCRAGQALCVASTSVRGTNVRDRRAEGVRPATPHCRALLVWRPRRHKLPNSTSLMRKTSACCSLIAVHNRAYIPHKTYAPFGRTVSEMTQSG